ncbi:MAG TPA: sigma factor [Kofleriaceae bacterium]|nr:sigma factor [Kofleriaceae bacterium]
MDTNPTWWQAFQEGDLDAFAALIEEHQRGVFAVAYAVVLDRGLAEDVAQEAFIAAFQRRAQLREPTAARSWLAAIARNLGRDLLRARKREHLVGDAPINASRPRRSRAPTRARRSRNSARMGSAVTSGTRAA